MEESPVESLLPYTLTFIAALVGGTIFGITGFGVALVLVPTLSLLFDARLAVVATSFPGTLAVARMLLRGGFTRQDVRDFWPLYALAMLGIFLGTLILAMVDPVTLTIAVALVLLLYVGINLLPWDLTISPRTGRLVAPLVGLVTGLLQGAVSISNPPLAIFLASLRLPKRRFVGMITVCFAFMVAFQDAVLAASGLYTIERVNIGLLTLIPTLLGIQAGVYIQDRIHQRTFYRFILLVLFITAISLLLRSFRVIG